MCFFYHDKNYAHSNLTTCFFFSGNRAVHCRGWLRLPGAASEGADARRQIRQLIPPGFQHSSLLYLSQLQPSFKELLVFGSVMRIRIRII
jgi:hypothetical protein